MTDTRSPIETLIEAVKNWVCAESHSIAEEEAGIALVAAYQMYAENDAVPPVSLHADDDALTASYMQGCADTRDKLRALPAEAMAGLLDKLCEWDANPGSPYTFRGILSEYRALKSTLPLQAGQTMSPEDAELLKALRDNFDDYDHDRITGGNHFAKLYALVSEDAKRRMMSDEVTP